MSPESGAPMSPESGLRRAATCDAKGAVRRRSRAVGAIRAAERFVFAPVTEPIAWRMEATGWSCDAADRYCWRCGHAVGPGETTKAGCHDCRGVVLAYDAVVRLGAYKPPLSEWIVAAKFQRLAGYSTVLGRLLAATLEEHGVCGGHIVVAPMPTPWIRRVSRGIDHSGQMARAVARKLGVDRARLLAARQHGPQHKLGGAERRERDLSGVFRRRGSGDLSGRTVVLVDDVLTTGRTARAACLALSGRVDLRTGPALGAPGRIVVAVAGVAGRHG